MYLKQSLVGGMDHIFQGYQFAAYVQRKETMIGSVSYETEYQLLQDRAITHDGLYNEDSQQHLITGDWLDNTGQHYWSY